MSETPNAPPDSPPALTDDQRADHLGHCFRVFTRAAMGDPAANGGVAMTMLRLGWPKEDDPPEQHAAMIAAAALWDAVAMVTQKTNEPAGIERHLLGQLRQILPDPELRLALSKVAAHRRADVDDQQNRQIPQVH